MIQMVVIYDTNDFYTTNEHTYIASVIDNNTVHTSVCRRMSIRMCTYVANH